jgi:hypothetical protein
MGRLTRRWGRVQRQRRSLLGDMDDGIFNRPVRGETARHGRLRGDGLNPARRTRPSMCPDVLGWDRWRRQRRDVLRDGLQRCQRGRSGNRAVLVSRGQTATTHALPIRLRPDVLLADR